MADRLGDAGAQPSKPSHYAPIFVAASLTGIWTQRHVFHDPSNVVTQRFYGGRPDVLYNGLNVELSNDLTIVRRPGMTAATMNYPDVPLNGFSFELNDGTVQVLVDTVGGVYLQNFAGVNAPTLLFNKSTGGGEGFFVASGSTLYYGNGVDLIKYTPGNTNGLIWNWGIAPPMAAPTATSVASGSSAVAWEALTVFSTMGLIVDPNGNAQQLFSVNANPAIPNSTQIGESSNGAPNFNTAYNATTTDGGVTWTSAGQISLWTASTVFQPGQCIYDPGTNCLFIASHSFAVTSGTVYPKFTSTLGLTGARITESTGARWENLGQVGVSPTAVLTWAKNTHFNQYFLPAGGSDPSNVNSAIAYPLVPFLNAAGQLCGGQPTYLLGATTAGTTANTNYTPWAGISSQAVGQITQDNQLAWICLGSATWAATTTYTGWVYGNATFSAIFDGTNMQVCISTGTSGSGTPTWGTTYGAQTNDGTVTWVCVGPPVAWAASTNWFLPAPGFAPPLPSQQYGGAQVIGAAFVQAVTTSGKSGGSAPSWSTTVGNTTPDGTITWTTAAAYSPRSITWTKSHSWAYSFKCRTPTDDYVTTGLLTFAGLNTPQALTPLGNVPGLVSPLGPYLGGGTGVVSTASPPQQILTPETSGAVVGISGFGSTDPQVDTIVIWRDADGGGTDEMFELIEIPAPKPIAGVAQPWTFQDFLPDIASTVSGINYPGLDNLVPAPIDDQNNPPPAGFLPLCDELHFSRVWGAVGNTVLNSLGPDSLTGNPNEQFNPEDEFQFKSTVIACIHTPAGLICPTTTDFECIYGGPSTSSFFDNTLFPGVGILSYNAWDIHGGEIYFVSSDSQAYVINPALQLSRIGFPVGNRIANQLADQFYVTVHDQGTDNAIYFAAGGSWWRLNPHQVGADVSGENVAVWSPSAIPGIGSMKMLMSVRVSQTGTQNLLLIGSAFGGNPILNRDTMRWDDNGTPYPAWLDIGAITMVYPGQRAAVKFIEVDFTGIGTQPLVSYVLDDPTPVPTWIALTNYVFDPPIVYAGTAITPTYYPDRFYLSQNQEVAAGRRIRIKVDFGATDVVQNEMISFAIFGRKYVEG